jgi:REP element-mobilizing transposase RayT
MSKPAPIYTTANTKAAYQLNWSLSLFLLEPIPREVRWLDSLKAATEKDAVRILEFHELDPRAIQFFISTQPQVAPSQIVRSVKGRLQHLLKAVLPKLFHRNYCISSVGAANHKCLDAYVSKQPARHPMADPRVQQLLESLQFIDESVDLTEPRRSSHGQFLNSLQIVLENLDHLNEVSETILTAMRSMVVRYCHLKGHLLARIGLVSNHMHILLGCRVDDSPQEVALALMNNLAYSIGMKAAFEFSFYAGTFGPYDRGAIRRQLNL